MNMAQLLEITSTCTYFPSAESVIGAVDRTCTELSLPTVTEMWLTPSAREREQHIQYMDSSGTNVQ